MDHITQTSGAATFWQCSRLQAMGSSCSERTKRVWDSVCLFIKAHSFQTTCTAIFIAGVIFFKPTVGVILLGAAVIGLVAYRALLLKPIAPAAPATATPVVSVPLFPTSQKLQKLSKSFLKEHIELGRKSRLDDEEIWRRLTLNTWDQTHPTSFEERALFPKTATAQQILELNLKIHKEKEKGLEILWKEALYPKFHEGQLKMKAAQPDFYLTSPLQFLPSENATAKEITTWVENENPKYRKAIQCMFEMFTDSNLINIEITLFPPMFYKMLKNLDKLHINGSPIKALEKAFGNFSHLHTLLLMGSHLVKLPDIFDKLPNLTKLTLSFNDLRSLPPSMTTLKNCTIKLNNNPKLVVDPKMIQQLHDQGCIITLPKEVYAKFPDLKKFAQYNPKEKTGISIILLGAADASA